MIFIRNDCDIFKKEILAEGYVTLVHFGYLFLDNIYPKTW